MFRKALLAVLFLAFGSVAVLAADFNGKWTTTPRGDMPISDGKIDGDNISFATVMSRDGNEFKMLYTGKAVGDTIKFTRQAGDRPAQEFTATRVK
jgi:hypothetical protein